MTEQTLPSGFPVYVAGSTDATRAVVVVQEAFGVNDHIRSVVERFVSYDDFPEAMKYMANLTKEGISNDLMATTDFLATGGYQAADIAVVGYCMGGTVSFYAATLGTFGAAASFYGSGIENGRFGFAPLLELAKDLRCPWIGLYGDLDQGIPVEQVEALRGATAKSKLRTEIVRYADAAHGFHCDARPAAYNESAAVDAHQCTLDFFDAELSDK
jgi:carboxymethylenebutenolidase